jgi:hypothetical protein
MTVANITEDELAALQAQLNAQQDRIAELSGGLVAGEKDGFAECMTESCDEYKALKPIRVSVQVVEKHFPKGSAVHGIESSTKYVVAADDRDLKCPACGGDRAPLEDAPRKIPKGY